MRDQPCQICGCVGVDAWDVEDSEESPGHGVPHFVNCARRDAIRFVQEQSPLFRMRRWLKALLRKGEAGR